MVDNSKTAGNDKFVVASFVKENGSMFVVPTNWLVSDTLCCWPPYATDARVEKAAKKRETVADNWINHEIRVLCVKGLLAYCGIY